MLKRLLPAALVVLGLNAAVWGAEAPSFASKSDSFFTTEEGRGVIDNILSWQGHGPGNVMGWPKAYDAEKPRPAAGGGLEWEGMATIDNGATYSELRLLARAISQEPAGERRDNITAAFNKGFDALLAEQYANGGWPQRFPGKSLRASNYARHITFNDNAIVKVLTELKAVGSGAVPYAFVDESRRDKARVAVTKGIECILNCQIVVEGKLTAWCAQHDLETLKPTGARPYEHPSISGSEGAGIAIFLMQIEKPDERVKKAIHAAAAWFEAAKISGKRVDTVSTPEGRNRVVVDDPASTIWARFYSFDRYPGKPIFSGRDGVIKETLAEIERERRSGYAWYGNWGENVAKQYAAWKKRVGE